MPPSKSVAKNREPTERLYGGLTSTARKRQRRERLIEAAIELFGTQGFAGTTIESLCAEAGVGIRAFYEEFGTRDALFTVAFFRVTDKAFEALQTDLESTDGQPLADRMQSALSVYFHYLLDDPRRARITAVETPRGDMSLVAQRRGNDARLTELAQTVLASHDEQSEPDLALWSVFMIGGMRELIVHWTNSDPRPDIDAFAARAARMLLRSLGA